jgi:hypothetical protein
MQISAVIHSNLATQKEGEMTAHSSQVSCGQNLMIFLRKRRQNQETLAGASPGVASCKVSWVQPALYMHSILTKVA